MYFQRIENEETLHDFYRLRYDVLHHELSWTTSAVVSPEDVCDSYDTCSVKYGVFTADGIVGGVRLITSERGESLPSTPYLVSDSGLSALKSEISRLVVSREYRRCGIARILLLAALKESVVQKFEEVVITVGDESSYRMKQYGFEVVRKNVMYFDDVVAPPGPFVVMRLIWESAQHLKASIDIQLERAVASSIELANRAAKGT